jgi:REP element-mobilizing transposase RayT
MLALEGRKNMAQTLVRVLVHVVFSTKDRLPSLKEEVRPSLFAYIGGTIRSLGGEPVIVNGVSDHVHILLTLPATLALADAMRALKAKSPGWLRRTLPSFAWQLGYAAFSVSESNAGHVKRYIASQEEHHRKARFEEEFLMLLKRHKLEYDERYLWR